MKKIWIISELYYPEETSTGYFVTKIAEGLAQGYEVRVISVQPTYAARGVNAPGFEERNGVKIYRCRSTAFDKDILLFRLINMVSISASIFIQMLRSLTRGDIVLVVSNPPLLPYLTAIACFFHRANYILLIHDVYPEVLIATGLMSRDGIIANVIDFFTARLYVNSKRIIVLGRDMQEIVARKTSGHAKTRIVIIPNWADVDAIKPELKTRNFLVNKMKLRNKFIIQYSGNMGRVHGMETIVDAARRIRLFKPVHFLLCGSGAKMPWLDSIVKKEKLKNVTILPRQPREELNSLLNACDVSIISFIPGMAGVSVPSRMYNIMAAGKPIIAIADLNSELAHVVEEEKIGWVVPPGDVRTLEKVILNAAVNPKDVKVKGEKARIAAEEKYCLKRVINAYHVLIKEIDKHTLLNGIYGNCEKRVLAGPRK